MSYNISLPECQTFIDDRTNLLPKEEDVRTYIRLLYERSIPGQEVVTKPSAAHTDNFYDTVPLECDKKIKDIDSYNLARSFPSDLVNFPELPVWNQPNSDMRFSVENTWKGTRIEPFIPNLGNRTKNIHEHILRGNSPHDIRQIVYEVRNSINVSVSAVKDLFREQVKAKGFIAKRGERDLAKEIELRQAQFPSADLIVIVGWRLLDHLKEIYAENIYKELGGRIFSTGWLENYNSIVLAPEQIRIRQEFVWDYKLERIKRYWKLHTCLISQQAIELATRVDSKEKLEERLTRRLELE